MGLLHYLWWILYVTFLPEMLLDRQTAARSPGGLFSIALVRDGHWYVRAR
jgi:hypothetical protein